MTIDTLTNFFMWCTILNAGMLLVSLVLILALKNVAFKMHGKLFGITRDAFNTTIYGFLGFWKVVIIVFNVVPWIALLIVKSCGC
jgi:hypothetical protein